METKANVIQNENGNEYEVIATSFDGVDTLLKTESENFIVAWKMNQNEKDLYTWQQGHYFMENEAAAWKALHEREKERREI